MSAEFKVDGYVVSKTMLSGVINPAGKYWYIAGSAFETFGTDGHVRADYGTATPETAVGLSGSYRGDFPSDIPTGNYKRIYWDSAIASQAVFADHGFDFQWSGTGEVDDGGTGAIEVSKVLDFVNEALEPTTLSLVEADIAIALKSCLREMSSMELLMKTVIGSVVASDVKIAYPSQFLHVKTLVFTDSDGDAGSPARLLAGDFARYQHIMACEPSNGVPRAYVEQNGYIWFYSPANGAYTYSLEYYADHLYQGSGVDIAIEFDDRFLLAIQLGTTYWKNVLKRNTAYMNVYGPQYFAELAKFKGVI